MDFDSKNTPAMNLRLGLITPKEFAQKTIGLSDTDFGTLQAQAIELARPRSPYTRLIDSMKDALGERLEEQLEKELNTRVKKTIDTIGQDSKIMADAERTFADPFAQPEALSPWISTRFKTSWEMVPVDQYAEAKYLETVHDLLVRGLESMHERTQRNSCTSITESLLDNGFLRMRAQTGLQYMEHPTFARGEFRIAMRRGGIESKDGSAIANDAPGCVSIEAIFSDRQDARITDMRGALRIVTTAADDLGITLHVNPFPINLGDQLKPLEGAQLQALYEGIGFEINDSGAMERTPHGALSLQKLLDEQPTPCSDQELEELANTFRMGIQCQFDDEFQMHHLFDDPAEVIRLDHKVAKYVSEYGYMTPEQAKASVDQWRQHTAKQIESAPENQNKVVISLFDLSGEWSKPWREAGYDVYQFDIQSGDGTRTLGINTGDVTNFCTEFFSDIYGAFDGKDVYAILAANPCTDFANSGARHFEGKDAAGITAFSVELVKHTLATIEYFKPSIWAIENPTGRIERLSGLPPWSVSFDPNHFGEDYTKRTMLWGRMNGDMPIAPCEATEGSKMHRLYGGKSIATKNARSITPDGFAYGFFMANNAADNPVLAIGNKYDRLDKSLIEQAVRAGISAADFDTLVEDHYYFDLNDEAANEAIMSAIGETLEQHGIASLDADTHSNPASKARNQAAEREFDPTP